MIVRIPLSQGRERAADSRRRDWQSRSESSGSRSVLCRNPRGVTRPPEGRWCAASKLVARRGRSADRDEGPARIAGEQLQGTPQGELADMVRGNLPAHDDHTMLLDNSQVADTSACRLANARGDLIEQEPIRWVSDHARVLLSADSAEGPGRVLRRPFLKLGQFHHVRKPAAKASNFLVQSQFLQGTTRPLVVN